MWFHIETDVVVVECSLNILYVCPHTCLKNWILLHLSGLVKWSLLPIFQSQQSFNSHRYFLISPRFYARLHLNNANVYTPDLSHFHLCVPRVFGVFFTYIPYTLRLLQASISLAHTHTHTHNIIHGESVSFLLVVDRFMRRTSNFEDE